MYKIIVSIVTALLTLGIFTLGIIGLSKVQLGLAIPCFLLSAILGYFSYSDIKNIIANKESNNE